jgi:3-deoxy-D-manno-octulosonic-acid transferase
VQSVWRVIVHRVYNAGIWCVVWGVLVPWECCRLLLGRAPSSDIRERLGRPASIPEASPARIVVHAVSVGEMHAASALVRALAETLPGYSIVLTCMTEDARRTAQRIRSQVRNVEACVFLPWDSAASSRDWLERLRPRAVVMVETEIWPNLFTACRESGIPLFVVSGRIYPRDILLYRLMRPFFRHVLASVTWLGVQTEAEALAFLRIGAPADRVEVVGNIKYDVPGASRRLPGGWESALRQSRPLIIAGSTHSPEERWLVSMLMRLQAAYPGTRLILAPRHVRRAGGVQRAAARSGLKARLWSLGAPDVNDWDVLVLDEMGWLATVYQFADVVVAGGTFARKGGHNVLEASVRQKAIVAGPHVFHIRQDIDRLADREALLWLRDERGLPRRLEDSLRILLGDAERRDCLGRGALEVASSLEGAAKRCAERIGQALGARR